MFRSQRTKLSNTDRIAVTGLSLLSAIALAITIWMLVDFLKEQTIVANLMKELPRGAQGQAQVLATELRWQFRLLFLVVINVIVTAIAVIMLWRAYRASQASLRDFKAFASDVLSGLDLGILTTDALGNVTSANRRGLELLDIDKSCIGEPLEQITTVPLKKYRDDWMAERSPAMVRDFAMDHRGGIRKLRAFCQALNDHEGAEVGHVLQIRDVTERVLIEERMRRMERYMGLGSLAGGLHHEIKNPLAALSLHVQLLEEQLDADGTSEENRQMLGIIRSEVLRIGGVLESFRNFASLDSLVLSPVDLGALLRQQVELMRPQAQQQSVEIAFPSFDDDGVVLADQARLEQVFLNLILNALEAMPHGGRLSIIVKPSQEMMKVDIADTGHGIPENFASQVLDPYFTTKGTGTGLGLSLCDKIIRQHQGTLDFVSSKSGTTFEVTLPREQLQGRVLLSPPDASSRVIE